jgi:cell division protein FtsW
MLALAYTPWVWLQRLTWLLWVVAAGGVVLTLIPHIGIRVGGAARWLQITAYFRFQPSELLKYTMPSVMALIFTNHKLTTLRLRALIVWLAALAPVGLLLKQPDFGSFAIITSVIFCILFSRGLSLRYVFTGLAALCAAFYFLIVRYDYRMARVLAFLDPWSDPEKKGFQVIQSMLGFHSGGVTGVGLGQGQGKLFFLPEAHTDFTLSVLGEELGFAGIAIVLSIFGFVALRGMQIAVKTRDESQKVICLGIIVTFAITSVINAGVAMGLLPTKGLGMPFLSYGGSHLLATAFGLGIILNIDRQARLEGASGFFRIK